MDGQEYLNQISASNRPAKKQSSGILSSPIFKIAIGGIAAFILLAVIGSALGGNTGGLRDQAIKLKLYIDTTMNVISTYQPQLKSSSLRSSSASLSSILSTTNRDLNDYLVTKLEYEEKNTKPAILEEEALHQDGINSELFNAKINGLLDRYYARKMTYEISMIMTKEATLYDATSDEALKSSLATSYGSLENIYNSFSDYSETK